MKRATTRNDWTITDEPLDVEPLVSTMKQRVWAWEADRAPYLEELVGFIGANTSEFPRLFIRGAFGVVSEAVEYHDLREAFQYTISEDGATAVATPSTRAEAESLIARLSDSQIRLISDVLGEVRANADSDVWGPTPTDREAIEDALWHAQSATDRLDAVVDSSVSVEDAARCLGIATAELRALIKSGALSTVESAGQTWIPEWQFTEDGVALLDGLALVLSEFPASAEALAEWVKRPHRDLQGQSPRDALLHGRAVEVARIAGAGRRIA